MNVAVAGRGMIWRHAEGHDFARGRRSAGLRATEVAAALGRGLEAGGWQVDLCPLADGGAGTLEVLLPALAGETAAVEVGGRRVGIGLIEDGGKSPGRLIRLTPR